MHIFRDVLGQFRRIHIRLPHSLYLQMTAIFPSENRDTVRVLSAILKI